jgi:hypothetical protein
MYRLVTKPGGFTNVDAPLSEEQAVELLCETAQSFSRRKARKVLRSYERRADPLFISMCHLVAARYGVHSRRAHKAFLRVAGNYEDAARALMYKYSDPVTAYYNRGVDPLTFHLTFERMRALFTSGMMSDEMLSELPLVWLFPFTSDRRLSPEEARVALRPLYDADVRTWSLVLDLATSDPSLPLMAPILVY